MQDDPSLAWEVTVPPAARPRRTWTPRLAAALRSGFLAGFLPGGLVFTLYYLAHRDLDMPWGKIALVLALYAPGVGITLAVAVEGLVMIAEAIVARVRWLVPIANSIVAAGIAGAICGILPGSIGVVVFGGYRGPFVGTTLIAVAQVGGALLVAVPSARRARRHSRGTTRNAGAVAAATLIATLVVGVVAAVVAPLLVTRAFTGIAGELDAHGATVGAVIGAMGGAILGLYVGLVIALARRL